MSKILKDTTPRTHDSTASAGNSKVSMSTVEQSFETEFFGDADAEFEEYLMDCWAMYTSYTSTLKYPFTTVV